MKIKLTKKLRNLLEIFKDSLFPNICICGKWGEVLCEDCASLIKINSRELCPRCRKLSDYGKTCSSCRSNSYLTGVLVLSKHQGIIKDLIWRHKYEFIRDLDNVFANLFLDKYSDFIQVKDFTITWVPISKERENWRGFNQSKLMAVKLSDLTNTQAIETLKRVDTRHQVGLKRKERIENIKGSILPIKVNLKNKKIILIDDVVTTGATLEECAKILRSMGAREVWGMVISRD